VAELLNMKVFSRYHHRLYPEKKFVSAVFTEFDSSEPVYDPQSTVFIKQGPTCSGDDQEEITWTLESRNIPTPSPYILYLYHDNKQCKTVFGGQSHAVPPTAQKPCFEVKIEADKLFCLKRSSIRNFQFLLYHKGRFIESATGVSLPAFPPNLIEEPSVSLINYDYPEYPRNMHSWTLSVNPGQFYNP
jgi:hypothetical protein